MNESTNLETVQRLSADLSCGDLPALLATLDPAVTWTNAGPDSIPYAGMRHGPAQMRAFFEALDRPGQTHRALVCERLGHGLDGQGRAGDHVYFLRGHA